MILNPQSFRLTFLLSIMKAKKNPPNARKTSTERIPAYTIKKIGLFPKIRILPIFSVLVVKKERLCPITTHIIANARTPSHAFRLELGLALKYSLELDIISKQLIQDRYLSDEVPSLLNVAIKTIKRITNYQNKSSYK